MMGPSPGPHLPVEPPHRGSLMLERTFPGPEVPSATIIFRVLFSLLAMKAGRVIILLNNCSGERSVTLQQGIMFHHQNNLELGDHLSREMLQLLILLPLHLCRLFTPDARGWKFLLLLYPHLLKTR